VLTFELIAAAGVGVALALTLVQNRYLAGEAENGVRLFHVWLAAGLWVVAWTGAAYDVRRRRRR
jgi:hypothetical protein